MNKQEFWKRCDTEMQDFIRDCKELQGLLEAFDGTVTGTTAPAGVIPFQQQDRTGLKYIE